MEAFNIMSINWKSPVAVLKAVAVFYALLVLSVQAAKLLASGADLAMPGKGYGASLMSLIRG